MVQRFGMLLLSCGFALAVSAASLAASPATQPSSDTSYEQSINKRADDVVKALALTDDGKSLRVHDLVASQYRKLHDLDEVTDKQVKAAGNDKGKIAEIKADSDRQTKQLHQDYIAALTKELTPEQIDIVKDKMTYNVLHVTYKAYCDMIPSLSAEQKAYILAQWTEARALAMDGGSSNEKHAIFGKEKGRINIYLSKAGYNMKEEEKKWRERRNAERAATSEPATQPGN